MKKHKKMVVVMVLSMALMVISMSLIGCTEADKISKNVSQEADNFNVIRRLTVINTRSNEPVFELISAFSIKVDESDNQLEVVCETGEGEYKKHFIGLNDETLYVVEDISGASVSKYKYEVNFLPEMILPVTLTNND